MKFTADAIKFDRPFGAWTIIPLKLLSSSIRSYFFCICNVIIIVHYKWGNATVQLFFVNINTQNSTIGHWGSGIGNCCVERKCVLESMFTCCCICRWYWWYWSESGVWREMWDNSNSSMSLCQCNCCWQTDVPVFVQLVITLEWWISDLFVMFTIRWIEYVWLIDVSDIGNA